jgi:hypothetical protein
MLHLITESLHADGDLAKYVMSSIYVFVSQVHHQLVLPIGNVERESFVPHWVL